MAQQGEHERAGADGNPTSGLGFLDAPEPTEAGQRLADDDLEGLGFVMNMSRLWAYQPAMLDGLSDLMGQAVRAGSLSFRQRSILVSACAAAMGDSYCSLAWGSKLASEAGADVAVGVLRGDDHGLSESERALARWARQVARDPERDAGWRRPSAQGCRLRRCPDLRHHRLRGPAPGLLHGQRRARRPAGPDAQRPRPGRRPRGRHVRPAGQPRRGVARRRRSRRAGCVRPHMAWARV